MESLSSGDVEEVFEQILYQLDSYLNQNLDIYQSPKFIDQLFFEIKETFQKLYPNHSFNFLIYDAILYFFENIRLPRSYMWSFKPSNKKDIVSLEKHIKDLQNLPQSIQKSDEWFKQRHELITASTAYKAVSDSICKQNELILKKCKPISIFQSGNITTPFHHGHKYEPISIQLYEFLNKTKIGEFGCILHKEYPFLGASPDGINIKKGHSLFGRALEIKNIVNRKITGIPSEPYWVQMQLQMECCELDECDFLETRFKEYESEEEFNTDGTFKLTKEKNYKGIIIQFYDFKKGALYEYPPFQCTKKAFQKWYDQKLEENSELTWTRNIYWFLDEYSCILVPRNKEWFQYSLPKFQRIWNIIKKERVGGYEHRKPKKRIQKPKGEEQIIKIETEVLNI